MRNSPPAHQWNQLSVNVSATRLRTILAAHGLRSDTSPMNRAWLLAVGVVWAAGCTCGGPTGPARDVFTSYCKFIDRCPEQIEFPIAYRSLGECVDILNFTATCRVEQVESLSGDQVPKLKQLTLNIDAAQAAACQAWLDTASCQTRLTACSSQSDAGCNPCSALFASSLGSGGGTGGGSGRALDEACDESTPCAPQLYCISARSSDDGGVSCRVCKPLRSVGGNCVDPPYVPCVSGLYCSRCRPSTS